MPEIVINDVSIDFPHSTPYNVQRTYMEKVIECLTNCKNGVLESPTGTGKTLSLLCSSLAWLKQLKDKAEALQVNSESNGQAERSTVVNSVQIPKIIYASRTHTQLTQAIKELKGSSYNYMKVAVFASRDQLCINPDLALESNANKVELCKSKRQKKLDQPNGTSRCECSYYEQFKQIKANVEFQRVNFHEKILDVEDLVKSGRKNHFCPYFMSKTLIDDADIVFMPYNYLLDPKIRNFIGIELEDAVVILDEAHNVPQVCEDSASIEFKSSHFTDAVREVANILDFINENQNDCKYMPKHFNTDELNELKNILVNFQGVIDRIELVKKNPNSFVAAEFNGDFIFTIMDQADIAYHTSRNITSLIQNVLQYVSDSIALSKSSPSESQQISQGRRVTLSNKNPGLRKLSNILWTTFADCGDDYRESIKKHYRVYVAYDTPISSKDRVKVVNYWCFSPKFSLDYLISRKHVRCIIFTSGTMSPLKPFITSLGIPIGVQLQNSHIIDRSQVFVQIISHGPDNQELCSNFENRSNPRYLHALGNTIHQLCRVIPNGLLIFFPSYIILNMCKGYWQTHGIWSQIAEIKSIFVEPRFKTEFTNTIKDYYKQINNDAKNGAIFMAVCRGKVSEGLDFADINGRAVIITGLPYAPMFEAKIRLKKDYMDSNCSGSSESLSGDQWYQLEASRAVNQAIGRVIRHRHDYGAILLCDNRFRKPVQKNHLSEWVQRHIRNENSTFHSITSSISDFFRNQQPASVNVISTAPDNQTSPNSKTQSAVVEQSQEHQMSPHTRNRSSNSSQVIPQSPFTDFVQQIASLPISSPKVSSLPPPSSTMSSDRSPNKRRCSINLGQSFNDEAN